MTELIDAEADNQEEVVLEATTAEDAPPETKNKRKRKAQSKKQLEGKCFFLTIVHYVYILPPL